MGRLNNLPLRNLTLYNSTVIDADYDTKPFGTVLMRGLNFSRMEKFRCVGIDLLRYLPQLLHFGPNLRDIEFGYMWGKESLCPSLDKLKAHPKLESLIAEKMYASSMKGWTYSWKRGTYSKLEWFSDEYH